MTVSFQIPLWDVPPGTERVEIFITSLVPGEELDIWLPPQTFSVHSFPLNQSITGTGQVTLRVWSVEPDGGYEPRVGPLEIRFE